MMKLQLFFSSFLIFGLIFNEGNVQELLEQADSSCKERSYQKAIDAYKKALDINKKCAPAHFGLAKTYNKLRRFDQVIKSCDKSLKFQNANLVEAVLLKAEAYNQLKKYNKSCRILKTAIENLNEPYQLTYQLALNYYELGNNDAAKAMVLNSISKNNRFADSHLLLSYLYSDEGQSKKAISEIYCFLLFETDSTRSQLVFQSLLKKLGRHTLNDSSAISNSDQFVEETKKHIEAIGSNPESISADILKNMLTTEHFEAYCNWISRSQFAKAANWIGTKPEKISSMHSWIADN